MKKSNVVWKKSLSILCAASLAVSSFLPGTVANAAEYAESAVVSLDGVELSGGAVVFSFNCSGDELYSIVQKGLKVLIGDKEIPYEPNYGYYGYNERGTYVKTGNALYFYPSDFEEGDNIVSFSSEEISFKIGVKKTTVSESWFGNEYAIETFEVPAEGGEEPSGDEETKEKLFVRLVGSFESKMIGEEDIDAVSSATTVYYLPEKYQFGKASGSTC